MLISASQLPSSVPPASGGGTAPPSSSSLADPGGTGGGTYKSWLDASPSTSSASTSSSGGISGTRVQYVPSRLLAGDSLESLARLYKTTAAKIAEANGVTGVPGTCPWAKSISAWVLRTGGKRMAPVASKPNNCEPDLGFTAFVAGQVINLPKGGPRDTLGNATPVAPASSGIYVPGALLAVAGLFLKKPLLMGAGVAMAARLIPPGKV